MVAVARRPVGRAAAREVPHERRRSVGSHVSKGNSGLGGILLYHGCNYGGIIFVLLMIQWLVGGIWTMMSQ